MNSFQNRVPLWIVTRSWFPSEAHVATVINEFSLEFCAIVVTSLSRPWALGCPNQIQCTLCFCCSFVPSQGNTLKPASCGIHHCNNVDVTLLPILVMHSGWTPKVHVNLPPSANLCLFFRKFPMLPLTAFLAELACWTGLTALLDIFSKSFPGVCQSDCLLHS